MADLSEVEKLAELLCGATLSQTSFDGHAVRIDFETRAEANETLGLLDFLRSQVSTPVGEGGPR